MVTVIENEAARVARLREEVVEVQIQSMHHTGGDKNRRAACNDERKQPNERNI